MALRGFLRIRWLLPVIGLFVALAFMTRRHIGGPGGRAGVVEPADASAHIGAEATVCGRVDEASHAEQIGGEPVFLNFGAPHPDQTFTAVIWARHRSHFASPPEALFDGEAICVEGRIRDHEGTPQIEVRGPEQIRIGPPPR